MGTTMMERISTGIVAAPRRAMIYGVHGVGKCFGKGTLVMMSDGSTKSIEDIVSGDRVMGPDSKPRNVLMTHSGISPMFKIKPNKGEPFICNINHEIYVFARITRCHHHKTITPVEWLNLDPKVRHQLQLQRTAVDFDHVETSLDPYFLGLWIGDGTKSSSSVQITNIDPEISDYLDVFAGNHGLIHKRRGICHNLVGYSRGESSRASTINPMLKSCCVGEEVRIPREYLCNSQYQRLQLLAGLIDSDGHLCNGISTYELATVWSGLADDICMLASTLGFGVTRSIKFVDGRRYHRLFISGDTDSVPVRIARKMAKPRMQCKSVLVTGFTVEPVGDGEFFGCQVDGDHLFLLHDTTIVHNSTFASQFEAPIFLQTEEGSNDIDVARFPLLTTFEEVMQAIEELYTTEHDFRTVVIDSVDWLERLIWTALCQDRKVDNIEGFGYGKGYTMAIGYWNQVLAGLTALRNDKEMATVFVAHAAITKFENPEADNYDRYSPKLHKFAAALVQEWCDEVLFATYKVYTKNADEKTGKGKGIGTGERVLKCTERPSHNAKNRLNMPDELPFAYAEYAAFLPK